MNQQDDRTFIKKFSGIIVGLVIFTVIIIALAMSMQTEPDPAANPSQLSNARARIAPVAAVRTAPSDVPEVVLTEATSPAAAMPETKPDAEPAIAVDGATVYNGLCQTCHAAGVAGAPVPGSDTMAERASTGMDAMVANVLNGIGIMPPRGGNASLSDDEIRAAVEYMMNP